MVAKYHLVLLFTATIASATLEAASATTTCTVINSAVTSGFSTGGSYYYVEPLCPYWDPILDSPPTCNKWQDLNKTWTSSQSGGPENDPYSNWTTFEQAHSHCRNQDCPGNSCTYSGCNGKTTIYDNGLTVKFANLD